MEHKDLFGYTKITETIATYKLILLTATANGEKVSTGRAQSAAVDYVLTLGTGKAFESRDSAQDDQMV